LLESGGFPLICKAGAPAGKFCPHGKIPLKVVPRRTDTIFKIHQKVEGGSAHLFRQGREGIMRRVLFLTTAVLVALSASGCLLNQYSSNPQTRMEILMNQSEDLRQIENEWRRFWMNDQPSHMTYERAHGGVGP
jgi:hypothetical protein